LRPLHRKTIPFRRALMPCFSKSHGGFAPGLSAGQAFPKRILDS
jgi:hypothetical protein